MDQMKGLEVYKEGEVSIIDFSPTYTRGDGLSFIDARTLEESIPFDTTETAMVEIPSGATGGNHIHPRPEAFVGFGAGLVFLWEDPSGQIRREEMIPEGQRRLFIVPPNVAHAVRNEGANTAILWEFSDREQQGVELHEVIE